MSQPLKKKIKKTHAQYRTLTVAVDIADFEYMEQLVTTWHISLSALVRVFIRNNGHKLPASKEAAIEEHNKTQRARMAGMTAAKETVKKSVDRDSELMLLRKELNALKAELGIV